MISVSDILKLLDAVPIWKTLKELPARVEALENQVAELKAASEKKSGGERCPACGEYELMRQSTQPMDGELGDLGGTIEVWACRSCGQTERRTNLPG
ncbi:hypothetical protein [Pseudodonghicola flavimaris]|uniref:Uncharacterized protein n=1 Tax=Pseudodonghicola flavimaris TaxID=3050036 RepID=A0ABT7EW11_9RHOB|nr:hypothetical protein [Pseudodonghicola flavimaris]MDK3016523.1 hypothetical protein [Pseudodonghicola flavimaris]